VRVGYGSGTLVGAAGGRSGVTATLGGLAAGRAGVMGEVVGRLDGDGVVVVGACAGWDVASRRAGGGTL
jgi:hypothetical protein